MSLSKLLMQTRPAVEKALRELTPPYTLFFSVSDGKQRAKVQHASAKDFATAWQTAAAMARRAANASKMDVCWLRVDWIFEAESMTWGDLKRRFEATKRAYFRYGIALDPEYQYAFLEQELNGNAMIYGGNKISHAVINEKNFRSYVRRRYGNHLEVDFSDEKTVFVLSTKGIFCDACGSPVPLYGPGRNAGRRIIETLDEDSVTRLIETSSQYLASQVKPSGRFYYGWHACYDKYIDTYNTLRHTSSTYAMLEAWEVTGDQKLKDAIDRSITYLTEKLIQRVTLPSGADAAFLVESNGEIKLGGNAVCLLALVKFTELTKSEQYLPLMDELALGIQYMQDPHSGKFVHVLQFPDLTVKEAFRIVYYDGEAAFGLMRLYGLTRNPRWLAMVEKAFAYFIAARHWRAHDHWLSYCVNELTLYRPEEKYYQFGIRNVADYLDFVENRITTFPTLLELMMAAQKMIARLQREERFAHLLTQINLDWFYRALHKRAHYLLNGYFWPEFAMFFRNPQRITGSFFIRHHAFRVRIDDVEHYLSGFVAYRNYLRNGGQAAAPTPLVDETLHPVAPQSDAPVAAWGGDVNLARRQHYRTAELGEEAVLGKIPALNDADLSIVNLECVVATSGEQGVDKGESAPYYYRARPEMLRQLAAAKIDVVTTANNHSGDYGPEALLEQCRWLDAVGIGHTGAGPNLNAALTPVIRPAGPLNVAIFSVDATQRRFAAGEDSPGCAYLPLSNPQLWIAQLAPRIQAARQRAQVVLVAVHWGPNLETHPGLEEIAVGQAIIDAGADAVLGASAHLLQGIEIYRERPIIHDAGDLLFDAVRHTLADSGVFRLELSHRGVEKVHFVPVGAGFGFSRQLTGDKALAASRRYAELCAKLGTSMQLLEDGSATITLAPPDRPRAEREPVAPTRYNLDALIHTPRPTNPAWQVDSVPEDARISPRRFGPLTLVGLRFHPREIKSRQLLWVESFWTADEIPSKDYRIDFRAVPTEKTSMPYWGKAMDHDPCDWQMPTSRWQPGVIYRDFYGLRPPAPKTLTKAKLQLHLGLIAAGETIDPVPLEGMVTHIDIEAKNSAAKQKKPPHYRTDFPPLVHEHHPGQTWNAEQLLAVTGGRWLVEPPQGWLVRSVVSGKGFIPQSLAPVLFVAHTNLDRAFHEQSTTPWPKGWDLHKKLPSFADTIAGAIVARPVPGLPPQLPVLQVDDPIKAIIELGFAARSRFHGDVIAITGTAGKSTTLKMLGQMLGSREKALTSLGNYNSRVGAPSMLASLNGDHEAAVIEVAQSALWMKRGPITRQIKPTIALITEIGLSQTTKRVKTVQDTAKWKSRIFDGLTGRAVAVVGEHLQCFDYVMQQARKHAQRVVIFGSSDAAEIQIVDIRGDEEGSWVTLRTPDQQLQFRVAAPSTGMVYNAVAALSAVYAMERDLEAAAQTLQHLQLDEGHLQRLQLDLGGRLLSVIDDSWNATISSMLNAFSVFEQTPVNDGGRKIAVLGRIVHLGEQARALHHKLAEPLLASGADWVITHGDEMRYLREQLPETILGPHFSTAAPLVRYLAEFARSADLILIKGSRRDSDFGDVPRLLMEEAQKSSSYTEVP
ncbi:UDP-N-acetylmuramyl pentapeptide synthase [Microbulbifer thermotolerans]|uniref:CapA family protein n=1 Tax=Microbulbifer thermotolerans TaxID=252514 RepID=UPI0008E77A31|nr:CapA family protein [Microbulbifer thermotolerans]SFC73925.1 UDP-N-acetylmuramyl pentapeptide synthase [Microbulbifer thermotolerans]